MYISVLVFAEKSYGSFHFPRFINPCVSDRRRDIAGHNLEKRRDAIFGLRLSTCRNHFLVSLFLPKMLASHFSRSLFISRERLDKDDEKKERKKHDA